VGAIEEALKPSGIAYKKSFHASGGPVVLMKRKSCRHALKGPHGRSAINEPLGVSCSGRTGPERILVAAAAMMETDACDEASMESSRPNGIGGRSMSALSSASSNTKFHA